MTSNTHAAHVWCSENPTITNYFYNGILNEERYLEFLNTQFRDYWEDPLPLSITQDMYFQQDGAPPHNSRIVRNYLNDMFKNRWIGTYGPAIWPPGSPDLSPLDFFLWGTIKDIIYDTPPRDVNDLKSKVTQTCALISQAKLEEAIKNVINRTEICIHAQGSHIEHSL
ncbi:hypothetical protein WH47_05341 [Habropoda laboriosa]|uniref:Transposable element Tc3 transposase n=1 Tax=Habropoda laboriosa TaxID=597456 RepID=A0A0L7QTF8_9HYME|nr:hypothetical protein WH47_05341 [Habropoda laboriosa]